MTSIRSSKDTRHAISSLFAIALFALFALLMLLMVVISAQGYRKTVEQTESTAALRTALGYVESKVLSEAGEKGIWVEEADGQAVLFLALETLDGDLLDTAIYLHEGMLMEQFYNTDSMDFTRDAGQKLIPLKEFHARVEGDLLTITVKEPRGQSGSLRIDLHGKGVTGK